MLSKILDCKYIAFFYTLKILSPIFLFFHSSHFNVHILY